MIDLSPSCSSRSRFWRLFWPSLFLPLKYPICANEARQPVGIALRQALQAVAWGRTSAREQAWRFGGGACAGRAARPRCGQSRGMTSGKRVGTHAAWTKACIGSSRSHLGEHDDLKQTELRTLDGPRLCRPSRTAHNHRSSHLPEARSRIGRISSAKRPAPFAQRPHPEWAQLSVSSRM